MDAKLDCKVDVEAAVVAVDMMDRGEERQISMRPCLRPNTALSPQASRQRPMKLNEYMNARQAPRVASMTDDKKFT